MNKLRISVIVCSFCVVSGGNFAYSQSLKKPKVRPVSAPIQDARTSNTKANPGDYFPKNGFKSPFRYIVVDSDLQFGDENEKVPVRHFVTVLMEEGAFNKKNLIYLFNYLSTYYPDPPYLSITVHTSLMTLQTPEEGMAASSRENFKQFFKSADYTRSKDSNESCNAGFLYDIGRSGGFKKEFVKLTCANK